LESHLCNKSKKAEVEMKRSRFYSIFTAAAVVLAMIFVFGINIGESADNGKPMKCDLTFQLKGWSAIYETMSGTGTITCDNGQKAKVKLGVKGGGLTAGVESLQGKGEFSEVYSIKELYGAYARGGAHAGAGASANVQVVTKGKVSLALSSTGSGVDLGISFGNFRISPLGKK
jgi:hypothetical protein